MRADVAERAVRRRAQVDRRLAARRPRPPRTPRGTPRWSRPGRGPGCGPARGRAPARGCRAGSRSTSSSISSTSTGASDSMPSTAWPSASFSEISRSCGCCSPSCRGPGPHLVGEQQLAARRRPQPRGRLEGALVGDREGPDLLDLVAPELHPQRVLLGRREDVDDAAADGELAALLDQVDPGVRRAGQPAYDVVELDLVTDGELDRLEVGEPLDLRLEDRADRRDDHLDAGRWRRRSPGCAQPAQHGEPPPDGVAARGQPLVRQRLPGRVVGDLVPGPSGRRAPRRGPRPRGRWPRPRARCGRRRRAP